PVLCFVSRTPRPPRSTLFPYTTLFRSTRNQWTWGRSFSNTAAGQLRIHTGFPLGPGEEVASSPGAPKACPRYWARARFVNQYLGDRKSTRLNSSHVKISYAVFCLKKKK